MHGTGYHPPEPFLLMGRDFPGVWVLPTAFWYWLAARPQGPAGGRLGREDARAVAVVHGAGVVFAHHLFALGAHIGAGVGGFHLALDGAGFHPLCGAGLIPCARGHRARVEHKTRVPIEPDTGHAVFALAQIRNHLVGDRRGARADRRLAEIGGRTDCLPARIFRAPSFSAMARPPFRTGPWPAFDDADRLDFIGVVLLRVPENQPGLQHPHGGLRGQRKSGRRRTPSFHRARSPGCHFEPRRHDGPFLVAYQHEGLMAGEGEAKEGVAAALVPRCPRHVVRAGIGEGDLLVAGEQGALGDQGAPRSRRQNRSPRAEACRF